MVNRLLLYLEKLRKNYVECSKKFKFHFINSVLERKNFLSYSYVLHKFVQLLELDEFTECFILLKSREKLHQQDQIWKDICNYLKWEFIPMFNFLFFYIKVNYMDFNEIINVQKNDNNNCVVFSIFAGNFTKRSSGNYDDFIEYIDKAMNTCVTTKEII